MYQPSKIGATSVLSELVILAIVSLSKLLSK